MSFGKLALALVFLFCSAVSTVSAADGPVGRLLEPAGSIEYSRTGEKWKPVTRTRYLFAGYKIRTGGDGRGTFVNQLSGLSRTVGPDSAIDITEQGLAFVTGDATDPFANEATLFDGISNKFAKAQRYTMLRRPAIKCSDEIKVARSLALSLSHPDLVWKIACPGTTYRLTIDGKAVELERPDEGDMVRYTVSEMSPGRHTFRLETIIGGAVIYTPRRDSKFDWLTQEQDTEIKEQLNQYQDDVFAQAGILESHDLLVPVMDSYREYFSEQPDDNDMRPLLIRNYSILGLTALQDKESRFYRDYPGTDSP